MKQNNREPRDGDIGPLTIPPTPVEAAIKTLSILTGTGIHLVGPGYDRLKSAARLIEQDHARLTAELAEANLEKYRLGCSRQDSVDRCDKLQAELAAAQAIVARLDAAEVEVMLARDDDDDWFDWYLNDKEFHNWPAVREAIKKGQGT